jgi:palmitoyl-protein thioesterase
MDFTNHLRPCQAPQLFVAQAPPLQASPLQVGMLYYGSACLDESPIAASLIRHKMRLFDLPTILSLLALTAALPANVPSKPLPLLIWHGLGDKYDAEGLRTTGILAQKVHPGTYVYYIHLDEDGNSDRTATFFGNVTTQIEQVCEDIKKDPRLLAPHSNEGLRVDALGFSQGGQFLRGLIERCDGLSVRSLVTFGSQHNGINQFQVCGEWDLVCKGATALIKGNAWTDYVQDRVVPAQYYRTINETTLLASDEYLEHSNFLADINNERVLKNEGYAAKIAALEKFVMYLFTEDKTVIPKESGWFAEVNTTDPDRKEGEGIIPLRERTIYKEDWLGLRKLDEKGGLVFKTTPGAHMELSQSMLAETYREYFGPETEEKANGLVRQGGALDDEAIIWDQYQSWRVVDDPKVFL